MELYAGTRSRGDKQDLDRIVQALMGVGRVVSPEPEAFYTAGQMVATYTRRYGQMALRDHAQDILIALWFSSRRCQTHQRALDCRAGHR